MADEKVIVVDAATGEVYSPQPRKTKRTEFFYMTKQRDAIALAKMNLTRMEHNVLLFLEGKMDYDSCARVSQAYIAEELGTTETTVSLSVKGLLEKGIITRPLVNGMKVYRVAEHIAARGKEKKQ